MRERGARDDSSRGRVDIHGLVPRAWILARVHPTRRVYLKALWFAWHDVLDGLGVLLFNLGLKKTAPPHREWNYAEKAEYWALMWGSIVMIVTGLMLLFTETVLATMPKVWHDVAQVIHYYEAVLATLAIVVWHFYWVIFDPKEFPMNPAWLIGKKAGHQESQGKGDSPNVPH